MTYRFRCIRRGTLAPLLCLAVATVSLPAVAQQRPANPGSVGPSTGAPQTSDQRKAQAHFQRAKELYQAGKYSDTIIELEVARTLDPKAKDLVMNLGIVHEKLGKYDEALEYLRNYLDMENVTPAERTKVEGMIKRIEGAKLAAGTPTPADPVPTPPPVASPPPPPPAEPPPKGRIDVFTIGAGSLAALALLTGTGAGIYALSMKPGSDFVTGRDGSYSALQQKAADAHTAAIVADVSIGIGIVATLATAWLYVSRSRESAPPPTNSARISLSPAPGQAGGFAFMSGSF